MILWLLLFLLVVGISFVLAYSSMRDFQELPQKETGDYSLYLIRKTQLLTPQLVHSIYDQIEKNGLIISLERLFKGQKSALTIFGPKRVLQNYTNQLDLVELEDYTQVDVQNLQAWEVGVKNLAEFSLEGISNFFKNFPLLSENEQLWWQLILQAKKSKFASFYSQIRAVVLCQDPSRKKNIAHSLQNLAEGKLTKLPKPFTNAQIVEFYQKRSLTKDPHSPILTPVEVVRLSQLNS